MVSCAVTDSVQPLTAIYRVCMSICLSVCLCVGIVEDHVVHIVERDPLPETAQSSSEENTHTQCACVLRCRYCC